ncbi:MAG: class I SAM-dependent methyltransferase [Nitrospiraceae bacterium]|nr:class I SAM-dependent methyltransferase [Nitrospiraceae bacterium]
MTINDQERERIEGIYSRREYDIDYEYRDTNPVYLQRVQSIERATIRGLRIAGLEKRLSDLKILDFGCGNGKWFGRWISWGASPSNLAGIDLRSDAMAMAATCFPSCRFLDIRDNRIPAQDQSFDIVVQNVVFSSILDDDIRHWAAREMSRVLKQRGYVFWCDFTYNNPNNPNVRAVTRRDLKLLFPGFRTVVMDKIVLAPPLARRLVPLSWLLAETVETLFPPLRTHVFAVLQKE